VATSSVLPSSPAAGAQTPPVAPPNFYAQAATAQPSAAAKPNSEDTTKFRTAIEKLVTIFDKIEKLKPNGVDISKKVKAVAQSLKDLKSEVFEGEEGDGADDTDLGPGGGAGGAGATSQTDAASPPPVAPGGAAGTGA
jgi:soluble cytochrome b562